MDQGPDRRRAGQLQWVQEWYYADIGQIVVDKLSTPTGAKLVELQADEYYNKGIGLDGKGLRVPGDLDDSICLYQNLNPPQQ